MVAETQPGSVDAGSLVGTESVDPNLSGDLGKSTSSTPPAPKDEGGKTETVPKSQYAELETRLGTQGKELGDLKGMFEELNPLLEKLEGNQELVRAIMDDKITSELVKSVLEGKATVKEATTVTEAHQEVKKELGKDYAKTSPEEINKLIEDKVKGVEERLTRGLSDAQQLREYEDRVNDFVSHTLDFPEYASRVNDYLDAHPKLDDVEIAYNAVKGIALSQQTAKDKEIGAAEAQKDLASNAAGGGVKSTRVIKDNNLVDQLVGTYRDPNLF